MLTTRNFNDLATLAIEMDLNDAQIKMLADWCEKQNPRFDRERWNNYLEIKREFLLKHSG